MVAVHELPLSRAQLQSGGRRAGDGSGRGGLRRRVSHGRGAGQRARRAVPSGEIAGRGPRAAARVRRVGAVTETRVAFVDVYVLRPTPGGLEALGLRRGATAGNRSPGSWETVHGHIEPGETPVAAALREVREETEIGRASCRERV